MSECQTPRAIIHVDMDAFYASVEQRERAGIAGKPVIVGGLGPRGVVSAASYEARKHGVRSAMPMGQARRLCPAGEYIQPRMSLYRKVSKQIFALFREVTPLVEGLSLDEAFLDVTGSIRLLGSREIIGQTLRDSIREQTGLQASVGMAHNKFLAKLASDAQKPAGFVSVDSAGVHDFLDPMPVGRLWGIGRKTEPRLRALGILTIGQLRRADEGALRSVLGNRTGHFKQLANGIDERAVEVGRADKSISQEITFDQDVLDSHELIAELQRQSEAVMRRVRKQFLMAKTIHVKIRDHRFKSATRSVSLRSPTGSTRTLFKVARGLLVQWLESNANTPVRLIGVGVSNFTGATGPAGEEHSPGTVLDRVMDDITDRYGDAKLTHALTLRRRKK